jgi:pimeloyl-[acyl-carrier protein] methyl ester esterase
MRGKPILWIHGWGMSPEVWKSLNNTYLPEYDHVYADFSLCHETSDFFKSLEEQMKQYELDFVSESDSMSRNAWIIAGWSMGAMLGIELAAQYIKGRHQFSWPVEKLLIIDGTLKFLDQDRTKGWPERVLKRMQSQLKKEPKTVLKQFNQLVFEDRQPIETEIRPDDCGFTIQALEAGLHYLTTTDLTSSWQMLQENHPKSSSASLTYLWIHGENDAICPIGAVPNEMTNHTLVVMKQEGHAPFVTATKYCYDTIRSFLDVQNP